MSGPIRPDQVLKAKAAQIPEFVFEAFNAMITKNWNGRSARVDQSEVLAEIRFRQVDAEPRYRGLDPFVEHWLDVESVYRTAGWRVDYDKPGFNESYEAFFVFEKK